MDKLCPMLELEVVPKLHEENVTLKQQMANMMREKGKGQGFATGVINVVGSYYGGQEGSLAE